VGAGRDRCHWCGRLLMEWGANSRLRGFGRGGASYRLLDQVRPLTSPRIRHSSALESETVDERDGAHGEGRDLGRVHRYLSSRNSGGAAVFVDQPTQHVDSLHQRPNGARLNKRQRGWTWRLQVQAAVWSYGVVMP